LVVFYPSSYVVLKNWNRKCFWTSVVYILWNGLYSKGVLFPTPRETHCPWKTTVYANDAYQCECNTYFFSTQLCENKLWSTSI